jgi:hypothetical protein
MRIRKWLLSIWLFGILFTVSILQRFSPLYREMIDFLFSPEWMHWIMHAVLFGILVILLGFAFRLKGKETLRVAALTLGVGILHEGFQAWGQESYNLGSSLFDLGIDFLGGLTGWLLFLALQRKAAAIKRRQGFERT